MAAPLGNLVAKMALESASFTRGLKQAAKDVKSKTAQMNKAMRGMKGAVRDVQRQFSGLQSGIALLGLGLVVRNIIKTSAEFQKLQSSLKTVTGSAAAASAAFTQIKAFAATTPFDLQQVTAGFIKLKALGLDPSEAAMQSYGNTASAMGKSLNQMIEAVADAATGEFERLKEFGIKAKSQGDKVTFTFQNVATTVGKNAKEIEEFLRGIGEVQFAGAMTEQAKTLGGALSNLSDSVAVFQNEIGEGGLAAAVADFSREVSGAAGGANSLARSIGAGLGGAVRLMTGSLREITAAVAAFVAFKLATVIGDIAIAARTMAVEMRAAAGATQAFTLALARNPIGLFAVAVSAAMAGLVMFNNTMDQTTEKIGIRGIANRLAAIRTETERLERVRGIASVAAKRRIKELALETLGLQENLAERKERAAALEREARVKPAAAGGASVITAPLTFKGLEGDLAGIDAFEQRLIDMVKRIKEQRRAALSAAFGPMTAAEKVDPFGGFARGAEDAARRSRELKAETDALAASLADEGRALTLAVNPLSAYSAEMARLNTLLSAGAITQDTFARAANQANERLNEQKRTANLAAMAIDDVMGAAINGQIKNWKDLARVALGALQRIIQQQLKVAAFGKGGAGILGGFIGSLFGGGGLSFGTGGGAGGIGGGPSFNLVSAQAGFGQFADGGRPPVGRPSIVGERGPELFVPDRAGTIIPNKALGGGGGASITINQSFDFRGADAGVFARAGAFKRQIVEETKAAVFAAINDGGVAASTVGRR